ncbi:MAG: hypothetical protein AB1Y26_07730 [Cycloclasticus sp.]
MQIPKTQTAWKRLQPSNLRDALRLTKQYARAFKRLTVPAIAELMGETEETLYKWLSTGRMPVTLVPVYEHICGIDYVTQYLAYRNYKLIIDIPTGKAASEVGMAELQKVSAEAMSLLIAHYQDGDNLEKTTETLTQLMGGVAYHRENIQAQPDLFAGEEK